MTRIRATEKRITDKRRNGKAKIPRRTESGRKDESMKIDTNKYYVVRGGSRF